MPNEQKPLFNKSQNIYRAQQSYCDKIFQENFKISHNTIVCQGTDIADRERERE